MVGGTLLENSGGGNVVFRIDDGPKWKGLFGLGTRGLRAYGCVHCKHLQFIVDFTEKDVERYRQFEGEQPGILERLETDN